MPRTKRRHRAKLRDVLGTLGTLDALARARRWLASLPQRLRASVHALLVLRALGAGVVVVVLAWVGGRSPAIPGAFAKEGASSTDSAPNEKPRPSAEASPAEGEPHAAPGDAGTCVCDEAKARAGSAARASPSDPVDVNAADEGELRRLPGVGPKRAEAIVALRRKLGAFHKIEELLRVKGVGRATLRRWRPLVRLGAPSPKGAADAGSPPG